MEKYYKVTKTLPPPELNQNNKSLDKKSTPLDNEEIKYLPCLKLLDVYKDCLENYKDNKNDCNFLLISAVIRCSV